jgi:Zn-dependent peptidase ImmA (M78 family)
VRRRGNIGKSFCSHWKGRTTAEAARKALEASIPGIAQAAIPINVESAARFVGIEQITEVETSAFDGLLSATRSGTYVASLRKGQSESRKRFTLAHELGHVIVHASIGRRKSVTPNELFQCRATTAEEKEEERLCDLLASQLLMPQPQFTQVIQAIGVSAETIPDIARRFAVSLEAVSKRLLAVLPYEIGIGYWYLSDDNANFMPKWYLTRTGPRSIEQVIAVGSQGSQCFTDAQVRGWQWMSLQGPMDKYFVDVFPLKGPQKAWLLLVVFDSAARHIMVTMSAIKTAAAQLPLIGE